MILLFSAENVQNQVPKGSYFIILNFYMFSSVSFSQTFDNFSLARFSCSIPYRPIC